jgi:hypothetical protein
MMFIVLRLGAPVTEAQGNIAWSSWLWEHICLRRDGRSHLPHRRIALDGEELRDGN